MKPHRIALHHLMGLVGQSTDDKLRKLAAKSKGATTTEDVPAEADDNPADGLDVEALTGGEDQLSDESKLKLLSLRKRMR